VKGLIVETLKSSIGDSADGVNTLLPPVAKKGEKKTKERKTQEDPGKRPNHEETGENDYTGGRGGEGSRVGGNRLSTSRDETCPYFPRN